MKLSKPEMTTCLVVTNKTESIDCLKSIPNPLIADCGADSNIKKKLENYSNIRLSLNNDISAVKNHLISLIKTDWVLFVEPWESLTQLDRPENGVCRAYVARGGVITKEIRLWHTSHKISFKNPVYESVSGKSIPCDTWLKSKIPEDRRDILTHWIGQKPFESAPAYYQAMNELATGNWQNFLNLISNYFFLEKRKSISYIMARFYQAQVLLKHQKDYKNALQGVLECIFHRPVMAEFWCLLGDIFAQTSDWNKARVYYENAMILGEKRDYADEWPVEMRKYKKYPENMLATMPKQKTYLSKYV